MFNLFENEGKALLFLGDDMTLIVKKLMIIRHVQIQYSLSIRSIHQSNFLNSASSSKSYLLNNITRPTVQLQGVPFKLDSEKGLLCTYFGTFDGPKGFYVTPRLGATYFQVRNTPQ